MTALLVVSFAMSAVTTACIATLVPAVGRPRAVRRAILALLVALLVTVTGGVLSGAETLDFLIGVTLAAGPVAMLLGAAADDSFPAHRVWADAIVYVWAGVVFPLSVIVPGIVLSGCASPDCRVEDFGGALPLLVSSAASALFAWGAREDSPSIPWVRFAIAASVVWVSGALWLTSLEGAIDDYTPRILATAFFGPLGGAAAWLIADQLRGRGAASGRSAAHGALAGFVAIIPGAATLSFPWSLAVGGLAGLAAALVYGARRMSRAGRAGHWAGVVLTAAAVGFFAPAVSGDTIGFIFSGRIGALVPPVAMFVAVAAFGVLVTAPVWLIGRRRTRSSE